MNTAPICCLVNLTGYCSSCPSPPSGYSAYNGKHYKYFGILDERTYQDAANLCLQDGALLAMPKSQAEIDHINGLPGAIKNAVPIPLENRGVGIVLGFERLSHRRRDFPWCSVGSR